MSAARHSTSKGFYRVVTLKIHKAKKRAPDNNSIAGGRGSGGQKSHEHDDCAF
jgi:hypothetical protein